MALVGGKIQIRTIYHLRLISEAKNAIKEFVLDSGADDEEDEI